MRDTLVLREHIPHALNPLGLAGIEFVEYTTNRAQALGQVLERLGFVLTARHRSREVMLYRQGDMNVVVNADADLARAPGGAAQVEISALALRVHDAFAAHQHCLQRGAWDVASRAQAMELHIPAIHGPGGSRFYFVDRWQDFSIFDIDFKPTLTPPVDRPDGLELSFFGLVQYIAAGRSAEWLMYYEHLLGCVPLKDEERFGIMPKGKLMKSPCGTFFWQLVEPDWGMDPTDETECLQRLGLGTPDVPRAVQILRARGVDFVDSAQLHPDDRGALTRHMLGSVAFELVHRDGVGSAGKAQP